ncbi:BatA domain-containing protein, partial [Robiginitalea biformata]|uniref:BatA domain-containing protein n=1 Tax=Robiginitalea biformata TaxID=252307 RepID=UPI003D351837
MSFTAPFFLWTLLGALFPLGIHLWSKREAKTIYIGSVELLRESVSRLSQSLRLGDI